MEDKKKVLSFVADVGHTLLENGAEIFRVEETMARVSEHYGAGDSDFFVLSNGIFTTGDSYAKSEYIPIRGSRLDKVVDVNQLSRDIVAQDLPLEEAIRRLEAIKNKASRPIWVRLLSAMLGCSAFCIIFGGGLADCMVCMATAILLCLFMVFFADRFFTKTLSNLLGGMLGTLLCIFLYSNGLGSSLPNMIVGTMILLIPGVAFTNGLRDISNEDYLSGSTRLVDALVVFFCIALGVCLAFIIQGAVSDGLVVLHGPKTNPVTACYPFQLAAAFIGTTFFAILFGSPYRNSLLCGAVGMFGWLAFLLVTRLTDTGVVLGTFIAAVLVAVLSRAAARIQKCPEIVYLICGIFPLIPGGGVFWSSYFLVSGQLHLALSSGFTAVKITIAIVFGIIVADNVIWRRKALPYTR